MALAEAEGLILGCSYSGPASGLLLTVWKEKCRKGLLSAAGHLASDLTANDENRDAHTPPANAAPGPAYWTTHGSQLRCKGEGDREPERATETRIFVLILERFEKAGVYTSIISSFKNLPFDIAATRSDLFALTEGTAT